MRRGQTNAAAHKLRPKEKMIDKNQININQNENAKVDNGVRLDALVMQIFGGRIER